MLFATNLKSNLNIAGAAKLAFIDSHVRLGITDKTLFAGSGTYHPISSAQIPNPQVIKIPKSIPPGTLNC